MDIPSFGKNTLNPGDRVLIIDEASVAAGTITLVGDGTYEGVYVRGDETSTEPIDRSEALRRALAGEQLAPRLRLDVGDVCWGDEVHFGDLEGGKEWLQKFTHVTHITIAEVRQKKEAKLMAALKSAVPTPPPATSARSNWRVDDDRPAKPDVKAWRCDQ